jgi:signal transduction histidine kinase
MNRPQTPKDNNDETAAWENMKKRVQNLFTGQEPPSYASIGEVDAMKTRISELEAELARQPKMDEQAATPVLKTKPDVILSKARDSKDQVQAAKKSWLPAFFSAPVFVDDSEKTRSAKLLYQIIRVVWVLPILLVTIGILSGRAEVIPPAIVISISLLTLMVLSQIGWVGLASTFITAMIIIVFGYADFQNAGNIQPSTLIIAIAIIMSGLLLGKRAPLVTAILIAISHAVIVYFQMQGVIELSSAPAVGFENIIITSIMVVMIGFLFQFVISRLQFALDQTRKNERELQISNRELQDLGTSLEQRVADRTHDMELASEVGRAISEKVGNLTEMLTEAAETIRSRFDLYYTQVYLVDPSGRNLVMSAGTGDAGVQLLHRGHRLMVSSASLNGRAASGRHAVLVADTKKSANFLSNPLLPLTRSELAIPLIASDKVVGVLDMQSERPEAFSEANLPAFQVLAGQLAIAIQNSALFNQTQEARLEVEEQSRRLTSSGWQEFLNAIERSESIGYVFSQNEVQPLTETQDSVSEHALVVPFQVTGAKIGEIRLADDANRVWTKFDKELVEAAVERVGQHIENLRLLAQSERYRSEAEQVSRRLTSEGWSEYLNTRKVLANGYSYNQEKVQPLNENGNNVSMFALSYPLMVRDESIGVMLVNAKDSAESHASEVVAAVVGQLSDHIESLRLLEQAEQRRLELETVATVSSTVSTVLDPDKLLQAVVDMTKERFGLYHAHIYLADDSWQTLLLASGAGEVGRKMVAEEHSIPMGAEMSLVARAARERQSVITNDVRGQPDFLPNPFLPETRAEMAVPMIVGDKVLGVFDVQSDNVNGFSKEDAAIYTTLASQIAVALQNARLYVEQAATVTQLRELDRLKSSFLANMSHELRTPLNSILGFTDVMLEGLDGQLTDYMDNDLRLIQKNGQHLLHLINDVLDMAKIESGKMNLNPEKFKIHDVLDEVTSITSTLASEKNLSLFIQEDSDQEVEIFADNTRLRQVVINLVNNSIKFTEYGKIALKAVSLDGSRILITVKDSGIGIPPDLLEAVFQEFSQVDTSTTRKAGGTGLGLPISRRLVEMHGGRLWAESTGIPGEGSTFFVELPVEARITDVIEKQEK